MPTSLHLIVLIIGFYFTVDGLTWVAMARRRIRWSRRIVDLPTPRGQVQPDQTLQRNLICSNRKPGGLVAPSRRFFLLFLSTGVDRPAPACILP